MAVRIQRTFGRGARGRPRAEAVSIEELPEEPVFEAPTIEHERSLACESFRYFLFEVMAYPDLDRRFHGALADFMGRERLHDPPIPLRALYGTRTQLYADEQQEIPPYSENRRYGVDLDGSFKGVFWEHRGDGADKLVLVPRNHLKSTVISVSYVLWRICKNPAIRVLIANAVLSNSIKFLKQMKFHFRHNERLHRLFPHLKITNVVIQGDHAADKEGITWTTKKFSVPRETIYEAGEDTVEATGAGGTLPSRHYDLVIADDLVNNKNVRTPESIENIRDWYEDAHSLLDPITGEVVLVGTRWDYSDLYSTALVEFWDTFSLFFATAVGTDGTVFFPQKFTTQKIEQLRKKHGTYKFSCQYLNQPTDRERADFKASWIRWWDMGEDKKGRAVLPSGHEWAYFGVLDPAITEGDGDASSFHVVAVNEEDDWYVMESISVHLGDIAKIIEVMFMIQEKYEDLAIFGVETRGWQKTIAKGAKDLMAKKGVYINVQELKRESNSSKKGRIMRLIPRFEAGKIFLRGKDLDNPHPQSKGLLGQYMRFPRGADDDMDSLAYVYDIAFTPTVQKKEETVTAYSRIMKRYGARKKGGAPQDDHMGSES